MFLIHEPRYVASWTYLFCLNQPSKVNSDTLFAPVPHRFTRFREFFVTLTERWREAHETPQGVAIRTAEVQVHLLQEVRTPREVARRTVVAQVRLPQEVRPPPEPQERQQRRLTSYRLRFSRFLMM